MDSINPTGSNLGNVSRNSSSSNISISSEQTSTSNISNTAPLLPNLADKVSSSSSDIREDVIARAEKLLNDPNWLSDENLDRLASRLIDNEDF